MSDVDIRRPKSKNLRSLRFAFLFLRPYRLRVLVALVALLFTTGAFLAVGVGLRSLVDQGIATGSPELLNQSVLVFAAITLLLAFGTFVRHYLVSWIGERVSADLRKAVFDRVIDLDPVFFEENPPGEIQTRITTDTAILETVFGSSLSIALRNFLILGGSIVFMFSIDIKLSLVVLACVPVVIVPILLFGRRLRGLSRITQDRLAEMGSYVGEALNGIKTLQAFNHQPHDRKMFAERVEATVSASLARIRQRSVLITSVIIAAFGAIAFLLWVGGHDVLSGRITGGKLLGFGFYAFMVATSVAAVSDVFGELERAAGATERLAELYEARPAISIENTAEFKTETRPGSLELHQVYFSYPSRPGLHALRDVSLVVRPREKLALVGRSGAGKSTLFDLLLRFYDPESGSISLDGSDIRSLNPADLRRQIGIVPQEPILFSMSVLENIRYGRPLASDEEVFEAARAAHAEEFIEKLPDRYDCFLGTSGRRLSGGQRQRIAIARAILKNPRVLLLDEATSALDAESESIVQQALTRLMQDRTTIIIAHRLSTVLHADRIALLEEGHLLATGTHAELLERDALYQRLAGLQFQV
ncbi:MAG: ATP-binding cassette domain-containing protein [Spirochaetales bacterium]|nr:ATP-binding cassette domain-containing protein [Leptospiraceae bacterium]MCP5483407.1 ATP-binding cassette domain-containing protein [Spirochaetales bacterium]MCP5486768.1 ATP-binding cassette domain-containing protein [Spirochaetales bacterium]